MNPLESKPPDPWPCAPPFLSRTLPCPSVLNFWPKLPGFVALCPCPDPSLRAFDSRFGSSTLGWGTLLWLHGCDHYFRELASRLGEVVIVCDCCWLLWSGLPLTTITVDHRLLNQGSINFGLG
uniref:Uncharacterized protein n=1 Tax=Opuntia streptacantha TaxID=393608 RepID=A0A7C8YHU2_OPUST